MSDRQQRGPWWARDTARTSTVLTWTWRSSVTVLVIGLIGLGGLGAILVGPRTPEKSPWVQMGNEYGVSIRPSVDALAARCGPIYTVQDPPQWVEGQVGTVPDVDEDGNPIKLGYISTVPFYGPMSETGVDTSNGKVAWSRKDTDIPRPEQVLRNLYDGWMVAYYSPFMPGPKIEQLMKYAEENRDLKMLVVPWPGDREAIPNRKMIAYATWGSTQQCVDLLNRQVQNFREFSPASAAPGPQGETPRELTYEDIPLAVLDPDRKGTVTGSSASPSPSPSPDPTGSPNPANSPTAEPQAAAS